MPPQKKNQTIVFSGVAPSGNLHLGNYIGAIRHWVAEQEEKLNFFCVVDLHAITVPQEPQKLKEKIYQVAALYLACGVDPQKSFIFIQSQNHDHAQLAWILDCFTPVGWLKRMTQFKEKSAKQKEIVSTGLFNYPVLMAADILLYQTDQVPVGEDQRQHLEITRDIAQRFNKRYGEIFTLPQAQLPPLGARIMSLQNPRAKMSKSDPNPEASLYLLDSPEAIRDKILHAVTDSGQEIRFNPSEKPGISNLMSIYAVLTTTSLADIEKKYQGQAYRRFKEDLAEIVIEFLRPIRERYQELMADPTYLKEVLAMGLEKARQHSAPTLKAVTEAIGLG